MRVAFLPGSLLFTLMLGIGAYPGASAAAAGFPDIVFPADSGAVDVTKPPYNAKGDGVTDDTAAILAALRDHNVSTSANNMMAWTIYLPAGTYLVSDSLEPLSDRTGDHALCTVRIVGQGRDKTRIRLQDDAPGFDDPDNPEYVLRTGYAARGAREDIRSSSNQPNSAYSNYIQHLTVDTGRGNPGAAGVRFDVANVGSMQDVRIISSDPDGSGPYGLGFFGTCGLGYAKRITVEGFRHGIHVEDTVNNIAFEDIRLEKQTRTAIYNEGKLISFRALVSRNAVPVLTTKRPQAATFLIGADCTGLSGGPAFHMATPSFLYLRDARIPGYRDGIRVSRGSLPNELTGNDIDEWWSHGTEFSAGASSLRLPIRETPDYENSDLSQWVNAMDFGATPNDDSDDDAPGLQAAIDAGKPVVYLPRGIYTLKSDVVVRGPVRKLDFMFSQVESPRGSKVAIRVRQDEGQQVNLVNLYRKVQVVHDSAGTVVIKNHPGSHAGVLRTSERATGDFYVETTGPHATIQVRNGIRAWLRAVNREKSAFLNDGGTVWFYGDNIESMRKKSGPPHLRSRVRPIRTINGGKTEYLAGCLDGLFAVHKPRDGELFRTVDATLSANAAGEIRRKNGREGYWPVYSRSVQDGVKRAILREDVLYLDEGEEAWPKRFVIPMLRIQPQE